MQCGGREKNVNIVEIIEALKRTTTAIVITSERRFCTYVLTFHIYMYSEGCMHMNACIKVKYEQW